MKVNKVLLGLFTGVMALLGSSIQAQEGRFFELGPSNVGGAVSCLAVDAQDFNHTTIFAGAATGGLYVRTDNIESIRNIYSHRDMSQVWKDAMLSKTDMWHYVPYYENDREVVLPISAMLQCPAPSRELLIGTGSDIYGVGSNFSIMSLKGRGLFRYNIDSCTYTVVASTKNNEEFAAIHSMTSVIRNGKMYLYVATNSGLYRWVIGTESDWSRSYETVYSGKVDQVVASDPLKMVYFSVNGSLYKISDATAAISPNNPVWQDISSTNSAFGDPKGALKMSVAPDPSYFYVMVIDTTGVMKDVYLTHDMQTWTPLATSSVLPFTANTGFTCGTIAVDPGNSDHIYIAGTTVYSGTGYSAGSLYQWMMSSMAESQLIGYGDYMQYVYSNAQFLHSGIHQILPVYRNNMLTYYIATDGGVFLTTNFVTYNNKNNGLNNVQINGIAVCPDGSVLSGANNNACPFIESRNSHDGGEPEISWFDDGLNGNVNHSANIIWRGNGGRVAASRFQQVAPNQRRNIYVSGSNGDYARSFKNYYNFTDNQVWTYGSAFLTSEPAGGGPTIGKIYTWETTEDSLFNDSVDVVIDTMSYVLRLNSNGVYNTVVIGSSNFTFLPDDKVVVLSRANAEYPFEYTFKKKYKLGTPLRVKNPIQSRVLMIAIDSGNTSEWGVYYSWRGSDFTKVYDQVAQNEARYDGLILWSKIYRSDTKFSPVVPRDILMSSDGRFAYVSLQNMKNGSSMLLRISGFENVDYTQPQLNIMNDNMTPELNELSKLHYDTLKFSGDEVWMPRPLSSMSILGDSIVLTFDSYTESTNDFTNIAIVRYVTDSVMSLHCIDNDFKSHPAYSAVVEKESGEIYVGIDEGVKIYNGRSGWRDYEYLPSIPVTSIVQQQDNLPVRRHYSYDGVDKVKYLYAKTKWPNAMYFGTYGRGIFVDLSHVQDTVNEISDSTDYLGIPTVVSSEMSSLSLYPNPVCGQANLSLNTAVAGRARLRIFDLNGRVVMDRDLGYVNEGEQVYQLSTEGMAKGMYLVNVLVGGHTAATKMMVR